MAVGSNPSRAFGRKFLFTGFFLLLLHNVCPLSTPLRIFNCSDLNGKYTGQIKLRIEYRSCDLCKIVKCEQNYLFQIFKYIHFASFLCLNLEHTSLDLGFKADYPLNKSSSKLLEEIDNVSFCSDISFKMTKKTEMFLSD